MKIWITSDLHLNHTNIIKYCNRPYNSVTAMNEGIIHYWNLLIDNDDIVIFLGDLCFAKTSQAAEDTKYWASRLNGKKIIVKGNHDFKKLKYTSLGFCAEFYEEWSFGRFLFCHNPYNIEEWFKKYDIICYGHLHQHHIPQETYYGERFSRAFNCCLDANGLLPLDFTYAFREEEKEALLKIVEGK